jgi:hypothetical protein
MQTIRRPLSDKAASIASQGGLLSTDEAAVFLRFRSNSSAGDAPRSISRPFTY